MTAETLKPFIPPTTAENFSTNPQSSTFRRRNNFLSCYLSTIALILVTVLLGVTIWNTVRISNLQTEVVTLNKVIESLQKRLGINYIDDLNELNEFEKEYTNALIDDDDDGDDDADDDAEDDDDDDEDDNDNDDKHDLHTITDAFEDYSDLIKKFNSYDDDDLDDEDSVNNSNISDDDSLYSDFEKFQDAKKEKPTRKLRSISQVIGSSRFSKNFKSNPDIKMIHLDVSELEKTSGKRHIVAESNNNKRSPLRPKYRKRRIIPMVKSGESLISAKSLKNYNAKTATSAAHFHLYHKIPDRQAAINVDSYPGDMYIGHASWTNEIQFEPFFRIENGVLTVHEPGLYYVYAQVCYNNTHDQNGFVIFHGHKPFLQCLNTVPTNLPLKIHTCHTSGLIYLKANETIHLRDFHSDRNVILKETNNRSYFGIMKV